MARMSFDPDSPRYSDDALDETNSVPPITETEYGWFAKAMAASFDEALARLSEAMRPRICQAEECLARAGNQSSYCDEHEETR